jgi:glucose-1-phosphate thymidylyltransferase
MILAGVERLAVICSPESLSLCQELLGDGNSFGIEISYVVQVKPEGISQAFLLAKSHMNPSEGVLLALGDNVIYGPGTGRDMAVHSVDTNARVFCYPVSNPENFGIVELSRGKQILSIEEKPKRPKSNLAIIGFYEFPATAFDFASKISKSERGEYEIVDLINIYRNMEKLEVKELPRGSAWLDAGTTEGFMESSQFVRALQKRQGLLVGSPHEAAWRAGRITESKLLEISNHFGSSDYGNLLKQTVLNEKI